MGLLEQVQSGMEELPPRLLVYGVEGIGKSKLAAGAPMPIFIQTEDGLARIGPKRFPLARSLEDVFAALAELLAKENPFQTVVIDTLDRLEWLIWDTVCRDYGVDSIEKADGGYQKGYMHALSYWRKLVEMLTALRDGGKLIILVAHAKVERFEDPEAPAYDRYSPRIHKHACAFLTEWCDAVLFATRRFRTETQDAGFGRSRTIAVGIGKDGGERVLRTVGGPSCVAKNRYELPAELPLSWQALMVGLVGKASEEKVEVVNG